MKNYGEFIKVEEIHFNWRNKYSGKYILQLGQIHFAICEDTFQLASCTVVVVRCIESVFLVICAHLGELGSPDEGKKRHIGIVPLQKFAT